MSTPHTNSNPSPRWTLVVVSLALLGCPHRLVWLGKHPDREPPSTRPDAGTAGAGTGGADSGADGAAGSAGGAPTVDGGTGMAGATGEADSGVPGPDASSADGPVLPSAQEPCPMLATGTAQFLGTDVRLWAGERSNAQQGPVVVYWHGPGSTASEAELILGQAIIDDITGQGGVLAAPEGTTGIGTNTGTGTWFTGDFAVADEIVACAAQQLDIDPRRIYTAGSSIGGVQAGVMLAERSSYLAAGLTNSGGLILPAEPQDDHAPAVITLHGSRSTDVVVVIFADASTRLYEAITERGGFAVNCDHGGGHAAAPDDLKAAAWQFLKDHPFGVDPEPYAAGLPPIFPGYCAIQ